MPSFSYQNPTAEGKTQLGDYLFYRKIPIFGVLDKGILLGQFSCE